MTPQERLAAEEIPTGTFGHALPPRPAQPRVRPGPTWTEDEQTQHCADLLAALNGWDWNRETRNTERRHLRLVDHDAA